MTSTDDPDRLKCRIAMRKARREGTAELEWRLVWAVVRQIRRETAEAQQISTERAAA
jgi:hypothetical protein